MSSKLPNGERAKRRPHQDAEVGYGKPPKHSQFKPGQSGNARGRPPRKLGLNDIVEGTAMMPVNVTVDGRARKMPALQAILMQEVQKALKGDSKAARFVLETFQARGLGGAVKGSQDDFASLAAGAADRLAKEVEAALEKMGPDPSSTPESSG